MTLAQLSLLAEKDIEMHKNESKPKAAGMDDVYALQRMAGVSGG